MGHPGCAGLVPGPGARASDSVSPAPCLVTDPCWHSSTPAIRQLNVGQPGLALQWGHVAVARTSHWGQGLHLGIGGLSGPNLTISA